MDNLPRSLHTIKLHRKFNQSINSLPATVTYLHLISWCFNQTILQLPPSLIHLQLFSQYVYSIVCDLPNSITHLDLYGNRNINNFPTHLSSLRMCYSPIPSLELLPNSLKLLHIIQGDNIPLHFLPSSLVELQLDESFNEPVNHILPPNLIRLEFGNQFNQNIDHLPSKLQYLHLGCCFNQTIDQLPDSLLELNIWGNFNQPIRKLPSSLQILELNTQYNQYNPSILPSGLQKLRLSGSFNQRMDTFPPNLIELELTDAYNQPFSQLPDTLQTLKLGHLFKHPLGFLTMKSIRYIYIQNFVYPYKQDLLDKHSKLILQNNALFGSVFILKKNV